MLVEEKGLLNRMGAAGATGVALEVVICVFRRKFYQQRTLSATIFFAFAAPESAGNLQIR